MDRKTLLVIAAVNNSCYHIKAVVKVVCKQLCCEALSYVSGVNTVKKNIYRIK